MSHDTLSAPGLLLRPQDTSRSVAGCEADRRRGPASGLPEPSAAAAVEKLAGTLVARLGPRQALLLASLLDEAVAEAESGS
jgi:hypothetical protein